MSEKNSQAMGASESPFLGEWFKEHHQGVFKRLSDLEKTINYKFTDQTNILEALTHRSINVETRKSSPEKRSSKPVLPWNERLEFLGDGVLGLTISTRLMEHNEGFDEGMLSKIRAALVSEDSLSRMAREIGLGDYLIIGSGEEKSGGRDRNSLLADSLEAIFGAVYIDSDFSTAQNVILKLFEKRLEGPLEGLAKKDFKTMLQELAQDKYKTAPIYEFIGESGPDHMKTFQAKVIISDEISATGEGASKKKATQDAAEKAWKNIQQQIKGVQL